MESNLIGKYKIIEHIGRGAMADVYKALHPELNRVVAIKVLNRALVHSPEMRARFQREARAVAALRHPNIVQLFDFDIVDDAYFMVMEYVEGKALNQHLADMCRLGDRMSQAEVLRVVSDVGEALHYAHEQGMLHRDVKPGNIMFRGDGSVVLTDFGVAKILNVASDITVTGAVAGTPAYMAPEQWVDDEPDRRSDIYSMGVVLYELITGELPFKDQAPARLMFKHISEPPPLPRKLLPSIPLELERVILRALAKDRQDRYQTAQEMVDHLRAIIYRVESTAPTGIFERPSLPVADSWKTGPQSATLLLRRKLWFWFGAAAAILFTAFIVLSLIGFGSSNAADATHDATGTALAVQVTEQHSKLSITPTLAPDVTLSTALAALPAPSPTPATAVPTDVLALTPSPSPALLSSPTPCVPSMALEQDVNFFNANWWSVVNTRFDKIWRVRNNGICPWPNGALLTHLSGQDFGLHEPLEVESLAVGREITLTLSLRAPSEPGNYKGLFTLRTPEGEPIGEPLLVELEARQSGTIEQAAAVRVAGFDLFEWTVEPGAHIWRGKVRLWATGGTGDYTWYRDTLDNPLPGDVLEFEWGICRDFFGSVWVTSGDTQDHEGLYIPYPEPCQ